MGNLVTVPGEGTPEDIPLEIGAKIPDVGVVVHRGSTAVEPDLARIEGDEILDFSPVAVVKP
jgi:hypothetical protein